MNVIAIESKLIEVKIKTLMEFRINLLSLIIVPNLNLRHIKMEKVKFLIQVGLGGSRGADTWKMRKNTKNEIGITIKNIQKMRNFMINRHLQVKIDF